MSSAERPKFKLPPRETSSAPKPVESVEERVRQRANAEFDMLMAARHVDREHARRQALRTARREYDRYADRASRARARRKKARAHRRRMARR